MPFLPDEQSTDRLLKNLGLDLFNQFPGADLKAFGWFQYRDHDHLQTLVSTELAIHVFLYLSFDEAGWWRRNPKVITAVIAFMARYDTAKPTLHDLTRLKQLIDAKPVDASSIADWFRTIYPPDPAPR